MRIPSLSVADITLPSEVSKLYNLAYNSWWAWDSRSRQLFALIDSAGWAHYRNPVQLLIAVDHRRWETLIESETFMSAYAWVINEFETYMSQKRTPWFEEKFKDYRGGPVAYFCMEYGVHESIAVYSGGLGVLAGDHLKSASDQGIPLVGVGLLYQQGYFHQTIDADGRQQHIYHRYDFNRMPIRPVAGPTGRELVVSVDFPDRQVRAKVWLAEVGRVPLLLLDTDLPGNDPADRPIANILYVRGREMRFAQEFLLGVGGMRALRELGIDPSVWHMNEGHSALLVFERIHELVKQKHVSFEQALDIIRGSSVFTTHTPVPAGHEVYDDALVRRYLGYYEASTGVDVGRLLELGHSESGESDGRFNLTALAIRSTRYVNAVSRLHAQVSNQMWRHMFERPAEAEQPIRSITNGIHTLSWVGDDLLELFSRFLGMRKESFVFSGDVWWESVLEIPDEELWAVHLAQKERLARFVRARIRMQFARHGRSPEDLRRINDWFDTDALTIGFARRFALYKRAHLLFEDLHRLRHIIGNQNWPVQIVLAGKAHPADRPAQDLVRHLFHLSQSDVLRGRVFFLEDYDMRVARRLVQGVDVWLNNPRRLEEASGTSGQKAAANGVLNLSVLDGWWAEGYQEDLGWAIGSPHRHDDPETETREDARSLYDLLEQSVVPTYYERDESRLPRKWIQMMKRSIATIGPEFSAARMVRQYALEAYFPEDARGHSLRPSRP